MSFRPILRALVAAAVRGTDRGGLGFAAVFVLSGVAVCLLVGRDVLLHPGTATVGVNPSSDYQVMTWSLRWWTWAIAHGVDPLRTPLLWAPLGFSTLWMTTIPAASLAALPLTLTAGPLVAYNTLMLLAVPLAAGCAFLLCRELTGRFWPSLVGGLLFGFSPYMLGHTLSDHLDLTFVFPVPLLALLVVRHARGKTSSGRFLAGFALLLLAQLGVSFELFLDLTLLAAIGAGLALAGGWQRRAEVLPTIRLIGAAYIVCLPVLIPIAVLALSATHAPLRFAPANFATDLLNVIIPTPTVAAGRLRSLRAVSLHFVSNIGEQDGYLGIPLLAVAGLAVRAEWRRGAWIIGGLLLAALVLSLGPILSAGGRPVTSIPFAIAHLPLLGSALPARLSLFAALAACCLCALWLAQPGRRALRAAVAGIVFLSLLPNFWAGPRLSGAWAISSAFGWSSPHASAGFVSIRGWNRIVRPGSTVLALPTGDRTAASYWQTETGMRFKLAIPATPFAPPEIAASPTVSALVNNVLPAASSPELAAARLRAFLIANHISTVVETPATGPRWRSVVAAATGATPVTMAGADVYVVRRSLRPLTARGRRLVVHPRQLGETELVSRRRGPTLAVWLTFDGARAHLHARSHTTSPGAGRVATLSSQHGDAELPAAAVDRTGQAAVAFVEWRDHHDLLRVATLTADRWRIATLDRSTEPIWAPRVVLLPDGTTVAAWIDERDPARAARAAVLPRGGRWQAPVTLDSQTNLGSLALAAAGSDTAVAAWSDSLVNEKRVRVAALDGRGWSGPATVASSLNPLSYVRLKGSNANLLEWQTGLGTPDRRRFPIELAGTSWTDVDPDASSATRPHLAPRPSGSHGLQTR